ncbi:MAG: GNAT family N-acetyltransferase [Paracoccaceae bacterium]
MHDAAIRSVTKADLPLLHDALQRLSVALGDRHVADISALEAAGFGPHPSYRALIAVSDEQPVGALVCSPLFSTTRGGSGLYVSDLWVAPSMRGRGLGRRLLSRAVADAETTWGPQFIKLVVYDDNPDAQAFYRRLGFAAQPAEFNMIVHGSALDRLKGMT